MQPQSALLDCIRSLDITAADVSRHGHAESYPIRSGEQRQRLASYFNFGAAESRRTKHERVAHYASEFEGAINTESDRHVRVGGLVERNCSLLKTRLHSRGALDRPRYTTRSSAVPLSGLT
jgi:hypothetical protein